MKSLLSFLIVATASYAAENQVENQNSDAVSLSQIRIEPISSNEGHDKAVFQLIEGIEIEETSSSLKAPISPRILALRKEHPLPIHDTGIVIIGHAKLAN